MGANVQMPQVKYIFGSKTPPDSIGRSLGAINTRHRLLDHHFSALRYHALSTSDKLREILHTPHIVLWRRKQNHRVRVVCGAVNEEESRTAKEFKEAEEKVSS